MMKSAEDWNGRDATDLMRPSSHSGNGGVGGAEGSVAVSNQMTRRFIPGKSVSHLPNDPLGSRIGSDANGDQPACGHDGGSPSRRAA